VRGKATRRSTAESGLKAEVVNSKSLGGLPFQGKRTCTVRNRRGRRGWVGEASITGGFTDDKVCLPS